MRHLAKKTENVLKCINFIHQPQFFRRHREKLVELAAELLTERDVNTSGCSNEYVFLLVEKFWFF